MSLLHDIESYEIRPEIDIYDAFYRTGIYMEKYIEKDIIQYQSNGSGGVDVVRSINGPSIFGWRNIVA